MKTVKPTATETEAPKTDLDFSDVEFGMQIEYIRLDAVEHLPDNPKDHDLGAIAVSIEKFGFADPIAINPLTGHDFDGNGRLDTLRQMKLSWRKPQPPRNIRVDSDGMWLFPAVMVEVPIDQEAALALALNRTNELGGWNQKILAKVLSDLASAGALEGTGYDRDDVDALLKAVGGGTEKPDAAEPQIDRADELQIEWKVEPGQIWQMGDHRIICGDCTIPAVVDALMEGEKAQICWTDPPWNVAYGEGFRGGQSGLGWKKRTIQNDNLGDKFGEFARQFCDAIYHALLPGGILYMAMSAQEWGLIMQQLEAAGMPAGWNERKEWEGFHWSSTIIWAKDSLVVSRKDYHTQYEPLWYGWRADGARLCPVEDRKQSDLWQINRPKRSDEHPTMKPVELVERSIRNSSKPGDICIDFFCGSGTTVVACERIERRSRTIELDPKYVAVTLQRWSDTTGRKPELVGQIDGAIKAAMLIPEAIDENITMDAGAV